MESDAGDPDPVPPSGPAPLNYWRPRPAGKTDPTEPSFPTILLSILWVMFTLVMLAIGVLWALSYVLRMG